MRATYPTAASCLMRSCSPSANAARTSPRAARPIYLLVIIQLEKTFQDGTTEHVPRLDQVRKMTQLCYFDEMFQAIAKKPAIVDVVAELIGSANIKLYTDQLMMKPRFHGTVTEWHQDSTAWPFFIPQDHVSCWIALDDATVD